MISDARSMTVRRWPEHRPELRLPDDVAVMGHDQAVLLGFPAQQIASIPMG